MSFSFFVNHLENNRSTWNEPLCSGVFWWSLLTCRLPFLWWVFWTPQNVKCWCKCGFQKAAIRGSAWHRQTEQLRTLHPNNYRRLYRDLAWDWFFGGVYLCFFFALDYLLCRVSWSVFCSSCHAVRGNLYISFVDIFSCGQVFRVQSWGKKKFY